MSFRIFLQAMSSDFAMWHMDNGKVRVRTRPGDNVLIPVIQDMIHHKTLLIMPFILIRECVRTVISSTTPSVSNLNPTVTCGFLNQSKIVGS